MKENITQKFSAEDKKWMRTALNLAQKGEGYVSPNPMVGCVIVSSNGKRIAQGYHEKFGKEHAEVQALKTVKNKDDLIDATVYVTLEPCSHFGKTPPCALKLKDLPVSRVVIAMQDPNPKVSGKGIAILKEAGKLVEVGCMEEEARKLNEAFIHYMRFQKPFVIMKMAQTLDGYIAAPDGSSQWITGKQARAKVHEWRSKFDAVMVGRNTALTDNPRLTVRHVDGRQPKRIVIDGPLSLPKELHLFSDQYSSNTIVITHNRGKYQAGADPMLTLLSNDSFTGQTLLVGKKENHTNLDEALHELGKLGIASILVEPGLDLGGALIRQNLVDKLHLFIAPKILGGGTKSILGLGINRIDEAIKLHDSHYEMIGDDLLFTGYF